jgi:hypothetical protein
MAEWIKNREWDSLKKHLCTVLGDRVDGDRLSEILASIDGKQLN